MPARACLPQLWPSSLLSSSSSSGFSDRPSEPVEDRAPGDASAWPRVMILAGEASGDAHAAGVAHEIQRRWPRARMSGIGGDRMAGAGVRLLASLDELAFMGFAEVAGRIGHFLRLERRLRALLRGGGFDIVVPVDYPGFNLRMTRHAHRLGIPVLYYIGPQVWAWKAGRARKLARAARAIALILPFEPELYRVHGGNAVFVGHPLLDGEREGGRGEGDRRAKAGDALAARLGIDRERPVLALFPGSRTQELRCHAKVFAETALELRRRIPALQIAVSRVPFLPSESYDAFPFSITTDGEALRAIATAGLVKSGTSTLEAALAGLPFAAAYIAHPVTVFLARRLVRVPAIALPNLVAGRHVVPEFVQGEATPERVADALEPLLHPASPARLRTVRALGEVRAALGTPGAARRVVDLMAEILEPAPSSGHPARAHRRPA